MFLFWLKSPSGSPSASEKQSIWPPANSLVFLPPTGYLGLSSVPWTQSHVLIPDPSHLCVLCPRCSSSRYLHVGNSSLFPPQVLFNCRSPQGLPRASPFNQNWNPAPSLDFPAPSPCFIFLHTTYRLPVCDLFLLFVCSSLPPLNVGSYNEGIFFFLVFSVLSSPPHLE